MKVKQNVAPREKILTLIDSSFSAMLLVFFLVWMALICFTVLLSLMSLTIPASILLIFTASLFLLCLISSCVMWHIKKNRTCYVNDDGDYYTGGAILTMLKVDSANKVIQAADDIMWKDRQGSQIYKIFAVQNWSYKWEDNGIVCDTKITAQNQHAIITLPLTITIFLDGDFDPQELYNTVVIGADNKDNINLLTFVASSFFKAIKDNRQKITEELMKYRGQETDRVQIINKIISYLTFPNRLLSNFAEWKINLGQPVISACKGSLCSK